jgi:hypothetical protein
LRIAGFVLPSLLIAALVGLDYFVLETLMLSGFASRHGGRGHRPRARILNLPSSAVLSALQLRERQQTARLGGP